MREAGPGQWAREEFGGLKVGDRRWRKRLVDMGEQVARRPAGRVTETFRSSAGRQGAYGLLETGGVTSAEVGTAIFEACARRSAGEAYVFCPIDGTSLTLTDDEKVKGFGPIGTRAQGRRGLKVMNAMVLSPKGIALGVSAQQWWTRPSQRRQMHRDQLEPDQKETRHWLEAIKQTRQVMAAHAPSTKCWFQLDREGDAWPMLQEAGLGDQWFTIRACRKRRVLLADGSRTYLHPLLSQQPAKATYELPVKASAGRQARRATMVVRACRVTLDIRDKRTSRRFPLAVNVVQAVERGSTPAGEKPLAWTLLTNRPIETTTDLTDVILGYSMRWRIEELHRTWKSGACRVEENQLRSATAVIKWATILIAVAARIERIKQLSRQEPQRPATDEFSAAEIKAAALLHFGKAGNAKVAPDKTPTIGEVTLWIANIGGYTGRTSSGGPPGSIVLARGLESVRTTAKALEALSRD
jgi:hypothetical protein